MSNLATPRLTESPPSTSNPQNLSPSPLPAATSALRPLPPKHQQYPRQLISQDSTTGFWLCDCELPLVPFLALTEPAPSTSPVPVRVCSTPPLLILRKRTLTSSNSPQSSIATTRPFTQSNRNRTPPARASPAHLPSPWTARSPPPTPWCLRTSQTESRSTML